MKNKKKIIKNCIIIILLILVLKEIYGAIEYFYFSSNGGKVIFSDNDKLDTSNPMTQEEIIALLEKGSSYKNYVVTKKFKQSKEGTIFSKVEHENRVYVKDNIVKSVKDGVEQYWMDYDQNLCLILDDFLKASLIPIDEFLDIEGEYRQKATIYNSFFIPSPGIIYPKPEVKFEYLGEKDINGRRTIVTKTTDLEHENYEKYYIDKETGVIVNKERFYYNSYWLFSFFEIALFLKDNGDAQPFMDTGYNFSVEFDCVTDADVKKPNYTGRIVYNGFYEERKYNTIIKARGIHNQNIIFIVINFY